MADETAGATLDCSEASAEMDSLTGVDSVLLKRLNAEITAVCWRMANGVEELGAARIKALAGLAASAREAALLMKCL